MSTLMPNDFEAVAPSEADALLARESTQRLAAHQPDSATTTVQVQFVSDGDKSELVDVPAAAFQLFLQTLNEMSQGHAVTLIPIHKELTTQQAADLLNVSRPYLVKLLEEGKIPCRTVGKYRRVRFDDLLAFKRKDDATRAKVLDQLTAEAQELDMGY
jgi:excisionase family DNA binding protein